MLSSKMTDATRAARDGYLLLFDRKQLLSQYNMLRTFAKKVLTTKPIGRSLSAAPAATAAPSVKDLLIDLTFVDPGGARRKVKGVIGKFSVFTMFRLNESARGMR